MDHALAKVRETIATSRAPAVLSSFGKDSMLLLWLIREVFTGDLPVIWWRTGHNERFGRRMVREWNLTVFRWAPAEVYVLGDCGPRTLVHEYGINGTRLPVLIDLEEGSGPCAADKFNLRTPNVNLPFDTLLMGYKDSDSHWVKGDAELFGDINLGPAKVVAPLRHLTDEQVRAAIAENRIPYEPVPDDLVLCTRCVSTLPLPTFRSRFNLTEEVHVNGTGIR